MKYFLAVGYYINNWADCAHFSKVVLIVWRMEYMMRPQIFLSVSYQGTVIISMGKADCQACVFIHALSTVEMKFLGKITKNQSCYLAIGRVPGGVICQSNMRYDHLDTQHLLCYQICATLPFPLFPISCLSTFIQRPCVCSLAWPPFLIGKASAVRTVCFCTLPLFALRENSDKKMCKSRHFLAFSWT